MKKRILSVALAGVMSVFLTGCGAEMNTESAQDNSLMFVYVGCGDGWKAVYHKETKVMYVISRYGSGSGTFTLLVNADGKPMLWESEE